MYMGVCMTNFIGYKNNNFNGDFNMGSLFCGGEKVFLNKSLNFNIMNNLARMAKERTFLYSVESINKPNFINFSGNKTLLQLALIPLFSMFTLCSK